jgi:hypothetical protein
LYHYTDVLAVHSILKSRTIWLTDIRFLNDKEEHREGLEIFEKSLSEIDVDRKYEAKAIDAIRKNLIKAEAFDMNLNPLYIFSLSAKKDQLSQWRAYGSYAIEFDTELLCKNVKIPAPCIYKVDEKIERSTKKVKKAVEVIAEEMEKNGGDLGPCGHNSLVDLMHDAARFKHDGFKEEGETRLIIPQDDLCEIHYRAKDGMLTPYIEIKLPLECIRSIQLGPMGNQELAYISMFGFAKQIEHNWRTETSNMGYLLQVEKSPIPYRV